MFTKYFILRIIFSFCRHQKTNPKCVESCDVSTSEEVIYKTPTTVPVTSHPGVTVTTPSKAKLDRGLSGTEFMVADPSEVTHTQILDTLADLYSGCLKGVCLFFNSLQVVKHIYACI